MTREQALAAKYHKTSCPAGAVGLPDHHIDRHIVAYVANGASR